MPHRRIRETIAGKSSYQCRINNGSDVEVSLTTKVVKKVNTASLQSTFSNGISMNKICSSDKSYHS